MPVDMTQFNAKDLALAAAFLNKMVAVPACQVILAA